MKKEKAKLASYKENDGKYVPAFIMSFPDGHRKNIYRIVSVDKRFDTKKEANKYALSDIKHLSR